MRSRALWTGKTLYLATGNAVIPIKTATNKPGKPIRLGSSAYAIDMNPDGKTAYVTGFFADVITPINTATNKPGKPINVGSAFPAAIAFTPDRKTAYVRRRHVDHHSDSPSHRHQHGRQGDQRRAGTRPSRSPRTGRPLYVVLRSGPVVPINTATNKAGKAINGPGPFAIAITPNGKTVYVHRPFGGSRQAGQHRHQHGRQGDRRRGRRRSTSRSPRTARPPTSPTRARGTMVPINTATNTAGKPIKVGRTPGAIAITPDGKTLYAAARTHGGPDQHRHQQGRQGHPPRRPWVSQRDRDHTLTKHGSKTAPDTTAARRTSRYCSASVVAASWRPDINQARAAGGSECSHQ